ncbi:MAG: hypothetical protein V9G10_13135 [Candidatus Nanopelagicales bacterium]
MTVVKLNWMLDECTIRNRSISVSFWSKQLPCAMSSASWEASLNSLRSS